MFVKTSLIVICVVLLNLSECKKCEDNIFKCVVDWVASALTLDSSEKFDTIEAVTNTSADDFLLTDLMKFLVNNFTDIFRQGPFVKLVENYTKIYVQTFDINDSSTESAIKSEEIQKYNSVISNDDQSFIKYSEDLANNIIHTNSKEITNSTHFDDTSNISSIIISAANTSMTSMSPLKLNIAENNNTETYSEIDISSSQNFTSAIVNIIEVKEATTVADVNTTSEIEHKDEDLVKQTTTKGNDIADTYDFFNHNEIDVGELIHDNVTDYLDVDYIDLYKDTTNEDVEYTPVTYISTTTEAAQIIVNQKPDDGVDSVYPWIAALFVMDSESNQFEYICDGGLVSERVVLTAARCVIRSNMTVDVANILVILGKRSLQTMGPNERVLRVESIKIHENFTSAEEQVDLAVIVLAEGVLTNVDTQPAPLEIEEKDKSDPIAMATTGWHVTGPLLPLYLGPQTVESCMQNTGSKNTICAVLGDNETTCPSFGGLLVARQEDNQWRLKGIASGNPTTNGVCFNKNLVFTRIGNYLQWISKNVQEVSK